MQFTKTVLRRQCHGVKVHNPKSLTPRQSPASPHSNPPPPPSNPFRFGKWEKLIKRVGKVKQYRSTET